METDQLEWRTVKLAAHIDSIVKALEGITRLLERHQRALAAHEKAIESMIPVAQRGLYKHEPSEGH